MIKLKQLLFEAEPTSAIPQPVNKKQYLSQIHSITQQMKVLKTELLQLQTGGFHTDDPAAMESIQSMIDRVDSLTEMFKMSYLDKFYRKVKNS